MKKVVYIIFGIILLVIGPISLMMSIAFTLSVPKVFSGEAKVQIIFPDSILEKDNITVINSLTETQVKLISSAPYLDRLIQNLNLQALWGEQLNEDGRPLSMDVARSILRKNLKVSIIPETCGLISISVYQQDPNMVVAIANELARIYREAMNETEQQGEAYQVRFICPAETPIRPTYPHVMLNTITSIIIAGILFLLGLILFIRGVTLRKG